MLSHKQDSLLFQGLTIFYCVCTLRVLSFHLMMDMDFTECLRVSSAILCHLWSVTAVQLGQVSLDHSLISSGWFTTGRLHGTYQTVLGWLCLSLFVFSATAHSCHHVTDHSYFRLMLYK